MHFESKIFKNLSNIVDNNNYIFLNYISTRLNTHNF